MKSHLIQTSILSAALVVSSLAFAQSPTAPTSPASSAAVPRTVGPNSAFVNVVAPPGSAKPNGATVTAAQSQLAPAVAAGAVPAVAPPTQAAAPVIGGNSVGAGPSNPKAKELETLQADIALWKAKAELAKYRAEVSKAEQMGGTLGAPLPVAGAGQLLQSPIPIASPVRPAPSVDRGETDGMRLVSLRAFDGRFDALIDLGGNVVTVRAGDSVGSWKVTSIDSAGVKLTSGKRVRTLGL